MKLSRRNFFKGAAAASAAAMGVKLLVDAPAAAAQGVPTSAAFYRTTLGDFEVTVIRDAVSSLPLERLVANADAEAVNELLAENGFPTGEQPNNFKQMLVNTGENLILFDTGLGSENSQLIPTLELMGVAPGDINMVVISHFHPDHIGGVAPGGEVAFPNAMYMMPQAEWDFLNSDTDAFSGPLSTLQPVTDAGMMSYFSDGEEIAPGVQAVAAPGHTPGHHGFLISSGEQSLMNVVDAIIHPVISTQRTDWAFGFDANPEQATETRRALLDRIASENLMMFGYHFPFPGIGYVAATDEENTWRFTPSSY
jgi:glyoxylase-like metal-dependent hydrolase (beta-lactamase superfamily II)